MDILKLLLSEIKLIKHRISELEAIEIAASEIGETAWQGCQPISVEQNPFYFKITTNCDKVGQHTILRISSRSGRIFDRYEWFYR